MAAAASWQQCRDWRRQHQQWHQQRHGGISGSWALIMAWRRHVAAMAA